MRIFIEFAWSIAEKIGRKYMWINVERGSDVEVQDIFLEILPQFIGRELGETLYNLYLNREIIVIINGVIVLDPLMKLNDGDKILIQPLASGG